eukprot:TRINITY_DN24890_c0_g1_i1.p1 TRINITY_DN24890_c0_g1~~TRINITY_DN24890_c0_g1_i1.p1  ORF type:complete len:397 (+),score=89.74 TRINITY_DN24890_c0_g1_i1:99-1193(+)
MAAAAPPAAEPAAGWGAAWGAPEMKSAFVNGAYAFRTQLSDLLDSGGDSFLREGEGGAWLLGTQYTDVDQLIADLDALPWFSYRKGFHLSDRSLGSTVLTYDTGWGCVHRCGQMLMMTVLRRHCGMPVRELAWHFRDTEDAAFSIQRLARQGARFGKAPGMWLAPTTIGLVLKSLADVDESPRGVLAEHPLAVEVTQHATVDVDRLLSRSDRYPLLLLVPTMLGMEDMNPVYLDHIKACFRVTQCVGIIGGRTHQALYLAGYKGNSGIALDPHRVQTAFVDESSRGTLRDPRRHSVPLASLGACCAIGFYAQDRQDAEQLLAALERINAEQQGRYPIFSLSRGGAAPAGAALGRCTSDGYAVVQ